MNKSYLEKTIFKKFKKDLATKYGEDKADKVVLGRKCRKQNESEQMHFVESKRVMEDAGIKYEIF